MASDVDATVRVRGYYRKNGTYVQPHYRSNPDGNPYNNWSFPGNVNPYTGKVATGNPDTYLKNYYRNSGSGSSLLYIPYSQPLVNIPLNAFAVGSSWYCNSGYRKVGDHCEKVIAPSNATVYGSTWYCNNGYKKVGETCEKVIAPTNATIYGSSWYCNNGYRRVGNYCEKVIAPANATVYGSTWYCNNGYRRVGNYCEWVIAPANATVYGSSWYCNAGYKRNYISNTCELVK